MTAITAQDHRRKLKFVSQGLSDSAISAMEEHIIKNIRAFCRKLSCKDDFKIQGQQGEKRLSTGWQMAKNIFTWTKYLTFDILGDLCFSYNCKMLDSTENHYMLKVLPAGTKGLNIVRCRFSIQRSTLPTNHILDGIYAKPCQPLPRYDHF